MIVRMLFNITYQLRTFRVYTGITPELGRINIHNMARDSDEATRLYPPV